MSQENVHIQLMIDGVSIEGAVEVPKESTPRRVLLPILQKLTDTAVTVAEQSAAAEGRAASCRKGCDACCRQMVPISPTEAYAIAAVLDAMSAARAQRILDRFEKALEELHEKGVLARLLQRHRLSAAELKKLDRDYFAAGVACPFLEKKACSIHADRPLACREFLVTSDPRHCANPGGGKVAQLHVAKVSIALAASDDVPWIPLVLARAFVAKRREKVVDRPPAKELQRILKKLILKKLG